MLFARFFICLLFLNPALLQASEVSRIGYGLELHQLTVHDPDGEVATTSGSSYINLYYSDYLWRDTRYLVQINSFESGIDAEVNKIGQDISSKGFFASIQKRLRLTRNFKPWLGGGLGYTTDEFSQRHNIDKDGFLINQLQDRNESSVNLLLNLTKEWELLDKMELSGQFQYRYPFGDGIESTSMSLALFYLM
ncbi:MAG: hypothetical protein ACE5EH_05870 [Gammaproteobacteria bacterium]